MKIYKSIKTESTAWLNLTFWRYPVQIPTEKRLSRMRFPVVFLSPSTQALGLFKIRLRLLFPTSFLIHNSQSFFCTPLDPMQFQIMRKKW
jgi:hypothetical protein